MSDYVVMPKEHYVSACDALREKTGTTEPIKSGELADEINQLRISKEEQEKTVSITKNGTTEILPDENTVFSKVTVDVNVASSDSYYDEFWDTYQQNGERTNYSSAFSSPTTNLNIWTDDFKPKHDIKPMHCQTMFQYSDFINLKERLEELNIKFDTSNASGENAFTFMCRGCGYLKSFPTLDLSSATNLNNSFQNCASLESIELINVQPSTQFSTPFSGCKSLTNVLVNGEIGSTFDIKVAPLTVESAISILTHLINYAGTANEFVYSVLFTDNVWQLLNAEGATAPGDITWEEYVNSIGWNK